MQYIDDPASIDSQTTVATPDILVDRPVDTPVRSFQRRSRPLFTGFEDHSIELSDASALTRNYRRNTGTGATKGHYFSRAALEQLLSQEDVVGIRYYYTRDSRDRQGLVLVAVQESGSDLTDGFVFGNGIPTSSFCTEPNPLNS
jgi:hypothetical protein